jgi:hypothetical protein
MPRPDRRWWLLLAAALVALTWRGWGRAVGWPLTDADAWADVAWAGRPFSEQLLVPLTGGVGGANANFWRPAAMVQFWVQRRLFGWEAAGWHAWDLGLHVVAGLLLAGFVARTTRHRGMAALVAALFVTHPLADEVVPAVARNLDLLGIGVFAALHAVAARRPVVWLAGLLLALGAKESGALVPVWTAAWILLFRVDLGTRQRARLAAGYGVAGAVVVGAYLLVRARVLGGLGGYYAADHIPVASTLGYALARGFVEPVFPSLTPVLETRPHWIVGCLLGALGVATALFVARSPRARFAAFGALMWGSYVLLLGVTGTYTRRVLYVPTAGMCLVLVVVLLEVWARRSRVGGVLVAAWLLTALHASPLLDPYTDWGEAGRASEILRDAALWAGIPAGARVYLVDRPYRVDIDPRKWRLWSRARSLTHGALTYGLQAWLDEVVPGRTVVAASRWTLDRPVTEQVSTVWVDGGTVHVRRSGGHRTLDAPADAQVTEADGVLSLTPPPGSRVVVWEVPEARVIVVP